ncbi:MAG: hypothetical protein A2Y03_03580 [Omnitrophica WOR_2 bacterium GWF2_38_59]|nr:MAG: hypothetical protein A2Y03_03580 [Omnitrophica WOR_2 bacterium GWF2_38_59]OGX47126.1 MAG: hypothetical protein A2243_04720 [Omnitrophica WOR_2 bacterium RIFOXYA2_FULL_38_17]OGX51066.1 MAG: hypothetical protein A2267_00380 [Omnitrophica WOR_2 bacterium RIFOXYA12_FULL_38_10]OGX57110.1 MAG: hypothetical protein A2306_00950 [Omnitrophica WOR_2 bacterium RIFOXYB2_FULL_38_16]OGX59431.1 MAG: hypothetical protein A2447_04910 [Omnitrophica WOR_2 bacterium RIFOXYC2_FULL_38_12]HBG60574.1 hypothet
MKPYAYAILCSLTWGCVPIIEKLGLAKMSVWQGLFLRCSGVLVGIILLTIFKYSEIKEVLFNVPNRWYFLPIAGIMASFFGQIFFYNAIKTGEVSKMVPISGSYPLVSFLIGVLLFSEKLTFAKVGGVSFVVIGVMLLK